MGSLNGRIQRLEERIGPEPESTAGREQLISKVWRQTLDTIARIRRAPIDPEPWRYEVGKLRGESLMSIACHVAALTHLEHPDEEEARRILDEEEAERDADGEALRRMIAGMVSTLGRMREDRSE